MKSLPTAMKRRPSTLSILKEQRGLFLLLMPAVAVLVLFSYVPIYGVQLAFKDFDPGLGINDSPWVGFRYFEQFLTSPGIQQVFWNTLIISFLKIIFGFPAPIILAILINEVTHSGFKRTVQTISYLPHFISWIVAATLIQGLLSPSTGVVGWLYNEVLHAQPPMILADKNLFYPMIVITNIWKEVGWGTVIYLATMSAINSELYEAAAIDGCNRLQRIWNVTIPGLMSVMVLLLILSFGGIMNAGFDQVFNMVNPLTIEVGDIIDTYIYRVGLQQFDISFSTTVGLTKNLIGMMLLITVNQISKRFSEHSLW